MNVELGIRVIGGNCDEIAVAKELITDMLELIERGKITSFELTYEVIE